ncbi:MAG TPA: amidase family protein [Jatrophihabitans sp.]|jgi:amidase
MSSSAQTPLTAAEAGQLLANGAVTAVELARHYLDRIAEFGPALNAVIATDTDRALRAAADSDARRGSGKSLGPLDGIPILIKDNIEAAGLPATAGSRALLSSAPLTDAPLVDRLRAAGLVLLGSTNLSEWANFRSTASTSGWSAVGGQTRNPYDTSRNTSGSSSGSAVAVAARLAPLAVGTETDGSIVHPGGICGVVGFKPTLGTVPGGGIVPIASRQDTAGPMTRTVADATALYAVLSGRPIRPRPSTLDGRRVAIWRPNQLSPEVEAVLSRAESLLREAGCLTQESRAETSGPFDDAEFQALVSEFAQELPAYLAARPGEHPRSWPDLLAFNRADDVELSMFSDEIFGLAAEAPPAGSDKHLAARAEADSGAAQALNAALGGCDLAITLSNSPAWPIRYGDSESHGVLTSSPCAVTGSPSLTMPAGLVHGLPVGISVLGRRGQDEDLLSFAAALEALLGSPVAPPEMVASRPERT